MPSKYIASVSTDHDRLLLSMQLIVNGLMPESADNCLIDNRAAHRNNLNSSLRFFRAVKISLGNMLVELHKYTIQVAK